MASQAFLDAMPLILFNEGGLEDNPADPGGLTNFGISLRFLQGLSLDELRKYGMFTKDSNLKDFIRTMKQSDAVKIYAGEYWREWLQKLSFVWPYYGYLFDMCVNHGIAQAVRLFQRSVCISLHDMKACYDDGVFGDKTLLAVIQAVGADPIYSHKLIMALCATRSAFYRAIVEKHPYQSKFLAGWLLRAARLKPPE